MQLLGDVALGHAGDARRILLHGIAIQPVTGGTSTGLTLAHLRVTPSVWLFLQECSLHGGIVGRVDCRALGIGHRSYSKTGNTGKGMDRTHAKLH